MEKLQGQCRMLQSHRDKAFQQLNKPDEYSAFRERDEELPHRGTGRDFWDRDDESQPLGKLVPRARADWITSARPDGACLVHFLSRGI